MIGLLLAGCQPGQPAEPPDGWEDDGEFRWWQPGTDTELAFRDLSDFEAMGVEPRPEGPVMRNVQSHFMPMYRHHPEIVDSLFAQIAVPLVEEHGTPGVDTAERRDLLRRISSRMRQNFVEPRPRRDRYESPAIPDSLRGIDGTIWMQVYLNEDGAPQAIELIEGIHPTLDAIVMRNYAERTWLPAYLNRTPVASWLRTSVRIEAPEAE